METLIRLKASELDFGFFKQLKSLIKKDDSIEIMITTASTESEILKPESDAEMRNRIDRAIEEVESGADLITFSKKEFDQFFQARMQS
jgi:hypothetical protein